jgi:putative phosphoesterase
VVLADTHLKGRGVLPASVQAHLRGADAILHAGDVTVAGVLDDLREFAPLHAVLGNNDIALAGQLPERLELELGGVGIGMVHESGARTGRANRMRRWFPDAQLIVFGHSHQPADELTEHGQRLFNPGSAIQRRMAPTKTIGLLDLADGEIRSHRIVDVA